MSKPKIDTPEMNKPGIDKKDTPKSLYGPCALVFCSTQTGTWRVVRPSVDGEKCTLCGTCEKHCPTNVITTDKKERCAVVKIDMAYCKGCGICANVCPKQCIDMIDEREV